MPKLSDEQALALLKAALETLGERRGASVRADTALLTARTALAMLSLSLSGAMSLHEEELRGVIEPRLDGSTQH